MTTVCLCDLLANVPSRLLQPSTQLLLLQRPRLRHAFLQLLRQSAPARFLQPGALPLLWCPRLFAPNGCKLPSSFGYQIKRAHKVKHTRMLLNLYLHDRIHTHPLIHIHIHIHTYTYTHTHIHIHTHAHKKSEQDRSFIKPAMSKMFKWLHATGRMTSYLAFSLCLHASYVFRTFSDRATCRKLILPWKSTSQSFGTGNRNIDRVH
jgi:hypothetical protein